MFEAVTDISKKRCWIPTMKKFFKGLKKTPTAGVPTTKESPKIGRVAGAEAAPTNGYNVREKDLPKIHKAAWIGNFGKVKQLKKDANIVDKENR
jgi:hypothetical protein